MMIGKSALYKFD